MLGKRGTDVCGDVNNRGDHWRIIRMVYSYCGEHPRGREVELKESIRYTILEKQKNGNRIQNSDDNSG